MLEAYNVIKNRERIRKIAKEMGKSVEEYLNIIRAKRVAKEIGLAYWPAIAYGPKIDPKAYLIAEEILTKKIGSKYGDKLEDGRVSYGGWDSRGNKGISPNEVARMWYNAGCKNSYKFRLQVSTYTTSKKGETTNEFKHYLIGRRWLENNRLLDKVNLSRKAVIALGRLKWYSRWAAIHGLHWTEKPIKMRDLNWDAVKIAQKGHRVAIKHGYAPRRYEWENILSKLDINMLKVPKPIFNNTYNNSSYYRNANAFVNPRAIPKYINPLIISQKTLIELLKINDSYFNTENFISAANIASLFGRDTEAAKRFVKENGNLHDAGQFVLPVSNNWNHKGWAALASRYPVQIKNYLSVADEIELELGRVPNDIAEIRYVCSRMPNLVLLNYGVIMSLDEREDYENLWSIEPKNFEGIPAPGGLNGIKIDNLHLMQLRYNDRLQPLVGRLVNCCQHLHGAAASCARQSWLEGDAAIWVVYKDGRIVAESFVWRSKDGKSIVLDSVESLIKTKEITNIFIEAAKSVLGKLGVRKVYVGDNNYGVSRLLSNKKSKEAPECSFNIEYTDARYVKLVCKLKDNKYKIDEDVKKMVNKAIDDARNNQTYTAINQLLDGSGVYCEYCNAEVHPLCEVCPVCGNNIAEWVDDED
jgi:hypothetical protein